MAPRRQSKNGAAGPPRLPALECDLVMKGGVTSGVVYPSAVAAIARDYRLRSIGGTSAGAIAAAAAAAMEFGRTSGRNPRAAAQLERIPEELGTEQDGRPLLLRLFEPDRPTKGLFDLILDLQQRAASGPAAIARRLLGTSALLALLLSGALVAGLLLTTGHRPGTLAVLLALLLFACMAIGLTLVIALAVWVPVIAGGIARASAAGFGFCSGMARHVGNDGSRSPSLGEWLHSTFQSLAGLPDDEPLCFGDLWGASYRIPETARVTALATARASNGEAHALDTIPRSIDLALVASDITRAQSVEFPFLRRSDRYFVRRPDLVSLYPDPVVRWIEDHARASDLDTVDLDGVPQGELIRLPAPEDLPVLFAVRPSLSFPMLFRAVRLYVVRGKTGGGQILSELWLADGGITSNFPVHLFDSPIPSRPTFCINLVYADDELQPDARPVGHAAPDAAEHETEGLSSNVAAPADELVYMLRTNGGRLAPYTRLGAGGVGGLLRFLTRVVSTARQWNDNQLLDVPGYRDRIVHIRMRSDEGGFNLDMRAPKIADLQRRGTRAGRVIAQRFLPGTIKDPLHRGERLVLNWANHRMVRFRSFLAGLEVSASRFARTWQLDHARAESLPDAPGHAEPSIATMTEEASRRPRAGQRWGYPFRTEAQAHRALDMVGLVDGLARLPSDGSGVDYLHGTATSPRPKQRLVLRPPLNSDPLAERPSAPHLEGQQAF